MFGKRVTTWREVPICLLGYDIRRFETPGGDELYLPQYAKKFLWGLVSYTDKGRPYGATHIQYKSPWGFLIAWPLCFHFWIQFKPQATKTDEWGTRKIPGTEKVLLISIGFARWDAHDSCYLLYRWFIGGHWD